jgi:hypothetical protein
MEPVQLSADELRLWLGLHERELADAALNDPLVWSLYATEANKVAFIIDFLDRHGVGFEENHYSRLIIEEAAGRL